MPNPPEGQIVPLIRPAMPELDSLRGIAILMVLIFHEFRYAPHGTGGYLHGLSPLDSFGRLGVDLFFVLSGFLITGILLDSQSLPDYFRRFYIRRVLRILPLFYLVLALLYPLAKSGWLGERHIGWKFLALSAINLSNLVSFFGVRPQYAVLWSLAVEEQFYIVWPAAVRVLSRRGVVVASLLIMLICPLLRLAAYKLGYDYAAGYTWLIADELAAGALLAALVRGVAAERKAMVRYSALFLGGGIAMLAIGAPFGILFNRTLLGGTLRTSAQNFVFAGVLGTFLLVGTSRFKSMVQVPVLQFFGNISYGLYLIHMMIFDMVDHFIQRYLPGLAPAFPRNPGLAVSRFVLGSAVAIFLAYLSRKYFEAYFLRLKSRWTGSPKERKQEALVAYAGAAPGR